MNGQRAAVIVLLAIAVVFGSITAPVRTITVTAPPLEAPVPMQEMTAGSDAGPWVMKSVMGALPPADPRQLRAPCDELFVEMKGLCWIPLDLHPCPKGKAFEHEGKCYAYALRAEKTPTSGGETRPGVANP